MRIPVDCLFDELEKIALARLPKPPPKLEPLEEKHEQKIRSMVSARPWVTSAAKGALPAASLAALLPVNPAIDPLKKPPAEEIMLANIAARRKKSKIIASAAAIGAGAGLLDRYLKEWAMRHPRSETTKKLTKQIAAEKGEFNKISAFAGDLRRLGIGAVREPPFPTEDSKRLAMRLLNLAKKPGEFTTHTMRKHVKKPGPTIKQIAPLPRGR